MAICEFALHPCPRSCRSHKHNEVKEFTREELKIHLESDCPNRDHECEHCGRRDTYTVITQIHDKVCSKKVVPCPNVDCTHSVKRWCIKRHLENCEFTEVPCKYRKMGCRVKMQRLDMELHEREDKSHLHMSLDTVAKLEDERTRMKEKICTLEDKVLKSTFKVTGFSEMKDSCSSFTSPSLSNPGGYLMDALISLSHMNDDGDIEYSRRRDPTHIHILVCCMSSEDEPNVPWPFIGQLHFTLLNQIENRNHYDAIIDFHFTDAGDCLSEPDFISLVELDFDPDSNTQYLKDDTLYFRVSVEVAESKPWLECTSKK